MAYYLNGELLNENFYGLVVIKGYSSDECFLNTSPALPISVSEVLKRYSGIAGHKWPKLTDFEKLGIYRNIGYHPRLVNINQLTELKQAFKTLAEPDYRLIFVTDDTNFDGFKGTGFKQDFQFIGFDYGDYTFSVILNDIVCGKYAQMRQFATKLNENILLPNTKLIPTIANERNKLLEQGFDLESNMDFWPIMIWGVR